MLENEAKMLISNLLKHSINFRDCAGFAWDRVNFLHSSWYGAMVWICAENSVDNTGMF